MYFRKINNKATNWNQMQLDGIEKKWFELSSEEKRAHIMLLLEHTESSDKQRRDNVCRAILYLVQGME